MCKYCCSKLRRNGIIPYNQGMNCTIERLIHHGFSAKEIVHINKTLCKSHFGNLKQAEIQAKIDYYACSVNFLYRKGFDRANIATLCQSTTHSVSNIIREANIPENNVNFKIEQETKKQQNTEKPQDKLKKIQLKQQQTIKITKQPQTGSVGKSGTTPFKQKDFENLLSTQISKAYAVFKRHGNERWYQEEDTYFIDCSAGDMSPHEKTSPEILLNTLYKKYDFPTKLYLIDKNKTTFNKLEVNYNNYQKSKLVQNPNLKVILKNTDMEECLFNIAPQKYRYGLLYFDPNGFTLYDYETISVFLENNPRVDVILNVNTSKLASLRQVKKAKGFKKYNNYYFTTLLADLHKQNIWVRDNIQIRQTKDHSPFEFVMVFGTNMPKYNMGAIENFVPADSIQGKQLIHQYNYTKQEKAFIENNEKGAK